MLSDSGIDYDDCYADCLHYYAVKAYQPHKSDSVFTACQRYIINVHQLTTSCGKFNILFSRKVRTKYTQNSSKTRHFKCKKKIIFL